MGLGSIFGGAKEQKVEASAPKMSQTQWDLANPAKDFMQALLFRSGAQDGVTSTMDEALQQLYGLARQGTGLGGSARNAVDNIFDQGGMAGPVRNLAQGLTGGQFVNPAMQQAQQWAGGYGEQNNPFLTGAASRATSDLTTGLTRGEITNPAMQEAQRLAMGGEVGKNPFLSAMYGDAAKDVTSAFNDITVPQLDRNAAATGRLGSGLYAQQRGREEGKVGDALSSMATNLYGAAYEGDQGRRMQALGQYAGMGQQDISNRMAGAGMYGGALDAERARQMQAIGQYGVFGQQGIDNRLAGAGLYDQGMQRTAQAVGLAPAASEMWYSDPSKLLQFAQQRKDMAWQDPMRAWQAAMSGPSGGGSQVSSGGGQSPVSQLAQLGVTGAMMYGAFGGSDRRIKTDVKRLGKLHDGLPVYSFRYHWDDPDMVRIGVMAQEALELRPWIVAQHPSGFLMVDYSRLGG